MIPLGLAGLYRSPLACQKLGVSKKEVIYFPLSRSMLLAGEEKTFKNTFEEEFMPSTKFIVTKFLLKLSKKELR